MRRFFFGAIFVTSACLIGCGSNAPEGPPPDTGEVAPEDPTQEAEAPPELGAPPP